MIRIEAIGHLGQDATISEAGGKQVVNFSVAHTEKGKNNQEYTTWLKCAAWERGALAPYLKKGTQVWISGAPGAEAWKDKEGNAQATVKVTVFDIQLLSSKKEA